MPVQATQRDLITWRTAVANVTTKQQADDLYATIHTYLLDDPLPAQDQGGETASIRSQAFAIIAAAYVRASQSQAGMRDPADPMVYRSTRRVPIAGAFLGMMDLPGEMSVLIPVRSMLEQTMAWAFESPGISPGQAAALHPSVVARRNQIFASPVPPSDPAYPLWKKNADYLDALSNGDYPGSWRIRPISAFPSARIVIF